MDGVTINDLTDDIVIIRKEDEYTTYYLRLNAEDIDKILELARDHCFGSLYTVRCFDTEDVVDTAP